MGWGVREKVKGKREKEKGINSIFLLSSFPHAPCPMPNDP
jgi:hypothetical protein